MSRHLLILYGLLGLTAAVATFAVVSVVIQQHHQNDALHSIMCHAEQIARTSKYITPIQRHRAIQFYDDELHAAHLALCDQ